jgi:hypothetical protein
MAQQGIVRIEGMRQVRRQLREIDVGLPKMLSRGNKEIAEEVAGQARTTARGLGSTAAFVAPSIRASGTQASSAVRLGAGSLARSDGSSVKAALVAPGSEFGSIAPQFHPWRGNGGDAGYFLMPTIRRMRLQIAATALRNTKALIDSATAA